MDLRESADDLSFRDEVRTFLEDSLRSDFAVVRGRGGPGDEHALFDERLAWERHLGAHGWTCVGWPAEHGGRGLSLRQHVIYYEEYARARAPGRLGIVGEGLLGPTVIAFGTPEQQRRFLPPIVAGDELWCQGYSEPNAGSDLANIATRAERDGDAWVVHGQKVWTSLAHWADWCFVLARTSPPADPRRRHTGISYLLVPVRQAGVEIRPIVQMTGDSEFNEVFFDGARTAAANVVGAVDEGWKVAMGTLAFERGASTLGQQLAFRNELDAITAAARRNGAAADPVVRQRLARAHIGLEIMRLNALRTLAGSES
ncbi:MAG TPA: acyl-CoA dehydrogenase family protein, partial [Acidimicrobiales bacterium]|nr:acyl-CoA dehydrogenase family protein [Acidimicrobiales bacterium]